MTLSYRPVSVSVAAGAMALVQRSGAWAVILVACLTTASAARPIALAPSGAPHAAAPISSRHLLQAGQKCTAAVPGCEACTSSGRSTVCVRCAAGYSLRDSGRSCREREPRRARACAALRLDWLFGDAGLGRARAWQMWPTNDRG